MLEQSMEDGKGGSQVQRGRGQVALSDSMSFKGIGFLRNEEMV